jgi:hypothetical protein
VLKSTDSIACSWEKAPTKRTTIAAPRSATLVRCIFSLAITASTIANVATATATAAAVYER